MRNDPNRLPLDRSESQCPVATFASKWAACLPIEPSPSGVIAASCASNSPKPLLVGENSTVVVGLLGPLAKSKENAFSFAFLTSKIP